MHITFLLLYMLYSAHASTIQGKINILMLPPAQGAFKIAAVLPQSPEGEPLKCLPNLNLNSILNDIVVSIYYHLHLQSLLQTPL